MNRCRRTAHDAGIPVVLDASVLSVDGRAIEADAKSIADALVELTSAEDRARTRGVGVSLVIAGALPMKRVAPVLEALAATNSDRHAHVRLKDETGAEVLLAPRVRWTSTMQVDWKVAAGEQKGNQPPATDRRKQRTYDASSMVAT